MCRFPYEVISVRSPHMAANALANPHALNTHLPLACPQLLNLTEYIPGSGPLQPPHVP